MKKKKKQLIYRYSTYFLIVIAFFLGLNVFNISITDVGPTNVKLLSYKFLPEKFSEEALRKKAQLRLNLGKNNKLKEAYDLTTDPKTVSQQDKEEFVEKNKDIGKVLRNEPVSIEDIFLEKKNNIGFILYKTQANRIFDRWVFVNKHWYKDKKKEENDRIIICPRSEPHEKPPEFDRALGLIKQRFENSKGFKDLPEWAPMVYIVDFINCVDIEYADLSGMNAEGVFYFDKTISTPERLLIQIDNSYKSYDDLLTAILLVHELSHVYDYNFAFINNLTNLKRSCIPPEVMAFKMEHEFMLRLLNRQELNSVLSRIINYELGYLSELQARPIIFLSDMIKMSSEIVNICGSDAACKDNLIKDKLEEMIRNNPGYQEQCDL